MLLIKGQSVPVYTLSVLVKCTVDMFKRHNIGPIVLWAKRKGLWEMVCYYWHGSCNLEMGVALWQPLCACEMGPLSFQLLSYSGWLIIFSSKAIVGK